MAKELTGWTDRITLVSDGPCGLSRSRKERLYRLNIDIREERIARLEGVEGQLERIAFASGPDLDAKAMFFRSDGKANTAIAAQLGVTSPDAPFIRTAGYGKTHVPGVYVAGDMSRHVQLAIVAAGEGAAAAFAINSELLKEDLA